MELAKKKKKADMILCTELSRSYNPTIIKMSAIVLFHGIQADLACRTVMYEENIQKSIEIISKHVM